MSVRITGGIYRGIRVQVPKELDSVVRPTQDKVRQAIFSSLASRIDISEAKILDLFSGTGVMSFEAISRGASSSVLVDSNRLALSTTLSLAQKFKIEDKFTRVNSDCLSFIETLDGVYDIVFIDPPYRKFNFESIVLSLLNKSALSSSGIIVYEEDSVFFNSQYLLSRDIIDSHFSTVTLKTYGSTTVAYFKK